MLVQSVELWTCEVTGCVFCYGPMNEAVRVLRFWGYLLAQSVALWTIIYLCRSSVAQTDNVLLIMLIRTKSLGMHFVIVCRTRLLVLYDTRKH